MKYYLNVLSNEILLDSIFYFRKTFTEVLTLKFLWNILVLKPS